jgi:endonuclease III
MKDGDIFSPLSDHEDGFKPDGSLLGKRKRTNATEVFMDGHSSRTPPSSKTATSNQKPRRQPARRIKGPNGTVTVEPPTDWENVYNMTAEMRKRVLAPVDTMGCESLHEVHRSPRDQRLQILTSLMLSSQTKDTVTAAAINNLQANLPGGLNLESLLAVEPAELNDLISKVGFHNNKTKYIKQTAVILRDEHNSDIPDTIEGLVSLPGVGPKMAYLCMSAAWGRDEGIGVDVHVHRITNLWRWHKTNTPEQTRMELESWLPKEKWHDINHLLVGFGQTICLPVGRKCDQCDLATEKLCPSRQAAKTSPLKKRVKAEVEIEVENGDAKAVKMDEVVVETDDIGIKIDANLQEDGKVEIQALGSADDRVKIEPAVD